MRCTFSSACAVLSIHGGHAAVVYTQALDARGIEDPPHHGPACGYFLRRHSGPYCGLERRKVAEAGGVPPN